MDADAAEARTGAAPDKSFRQNSVEDTQYSSRAGAQNPSALLPTSRENNSNGQYLG
jgi:hypothetical protein